MGLDENQQSVEVENSIMNKTNLNDERTTLFWEHKWALSLTAPVLLALSFPPFNISILQIPAFIFLIQLSLLCKTKREVVFYAYPAFVLWNLFSTYWLMMATIAGGLAAIFANAAIMLIPLLIIRKVFLSGIHAVPAALLSASAWVGYEFLHHRWDLAWPWLTLGNGWSNLTGAIQFISATGVFGISFWIVLSASLFYSYLDTLNKKDLIWGCVLFLLFPLLSLTSMATMNQAEGRAIEVAIVQPNSDSYVRFGGLPTFDALLEKLLRMSGEVVTENTDVIIWPENALVTSLTINSRYLEQIRDSLTVWDTKLITGSGFFEFYDEENRPPVVRQTGDGRIYNVFNAALYLQPESETEVYRKGRLVPIVERFPFVEFFQKIDYFQWINWGDLMGYGPGRTADQFDISGSKTPALICYDSVFPGWVNRFVNDGAGFLTIITNDGWWGDSHGHIQHFAFARLRAIEHRVWIARSANNGISGIISPDGKVQVETEYWTEDSFTFTIYHSDNRTFYSRFGDWVGALSLIFVLFGLIYIYFLPTTNNKLSD